MAAVIKPKKESASIGTSLLVSSSVLLHERWKTLMAQAKIDDNGFIERRWNEILQEYGGSPRRYHALSHLEQMFGEVDVHMPHLSQPMVVELAVFFHDLIYDAKSATNEEDSADRFRAFAQEAGLSQDVRDAVVGYIIATKTHSMEADHPDEDLKIFLDIDMSILGQSWEDYLRYAGEIRQEYIHVPRSTYLSKRAEVLTSFLRQSSIYASTYYHEKLEATARENIAAEIHLLQSGVIPNEDDDKMDGISGPDQEVAVSYGHSGGSRLANPVLVSTFMMIPSSELKKLSLPQQGKGLQSFLLRITKSSSWNSLK